MSERHIQAFEKVAEPPTEPLELLAWAQRVSAVNTHLGRIAANGGRHGGSVQFREAIRKTCAALAKTTGSLVVAVARGQVIDEIDIDGPPPLDDPLATSAWAALTLAEALAKLISGRWPRDPKYGHLARLRASVRTTVQCLSPEVEFEARERLRKRQAKIRKRGTAPPLEPLTGSAPLLRL